MDLVEAFFKIGLCIAWGVVTPCNLPNVFICLTGCIFNLMDGTIFFNLLLRRFCMHWGSYPPKYILSVIFNSVGVKPSTLSGRN